MLAVRLQGLGYSDGRRGVIGYYELAKDARIEFGKSKSKDEKSMWKLRLEDLGTRVANALVEMDDLAGAGRHLESLTLDAGDEKERQLLKGRTALLYLRIGNVAAAKRYIEDSDPENPYISALNPLLSIAEGDYKTAISQLESTPSSVPPSPLSSSNLAVALLYSGQITKARSLLESLIAEGNSFKALTFNLSTIYELCTDRSRNLKTALAEQVAEMGKEGGIGWEKGLVDFKL